MKRILFGLVILFKWKGMKATQAYMMYDPTVLNNETVANN